jgi:hypothetical protein
MGICEEVKPNIIDRMKWKVGGAKYKILRIITAMGLSLVRWASGDNNYVKHANREFEAMNWPGDCEMQQLMCNQVVDLLHVFYGCGHSGSSAPYAVSMFKKLAMFEPLGPLTGEDSEWGDSFCGDGTMQNNRCSHVFKRPDGTAYDINGKVFREKSGACYTSQDSRVDVIFPYTPTTEYVDV